jgi:hypothetical protein
MVDPGQRDGEAPGASSTSAAKEPLPPRVPVWVESEPRPRMKIPAVVRVLILSQVVVVGAAVAARDLSGREIGFFLLGNAVSLPILGVAYFGLTAILDGAFHAITKRWIPLLGWPLLGFGIVVLLWEFLVLRPQAVQEAIVPWHL